MDCDREDFFYLFLYFTHENDGWKLVAPFITYESEQLVRLPHARRGWNPHLARLQFSMSKSNLSFFLSPRWKTKIKQSRLNQTPPFSIPLQLHRFQLADKEHR